MIQFRLFATAATAAPDSIVLAAIRRLNAFESRRLLLLFGLPKLITSFEEGKPVEQPWDDSGLTD